MIVIYGTPTAGKTYFVDRSNVWNTIDTDEATRGLVSHRFFDVPRLGYHTGFRDGLLRQAIHGAQPELVVTNLEPGRLGLQPDIAFLISRKAILQRFGDRTGFSEMYPRQKVGSWGVTRADAVKRAQSTLSDAVVIYLDGDDTISNRIKLVRDGILFHPEADFLNDHKPTKIHHWWKTWITPDQRPGGKKK